MCAVGTQEEVMPRCRKNVVRRASGRELSPGETVEVDFLIRCWFDPVESSTGSSKGRYACYVGVFAKLALWIDVRDIIICTWSRRALVQGLGQRDKVFFYEMIAWAWLRVVMYRDDGDVRVYVLRSRKKRGQTEG